MAKAAAYSEDEASGLSAAELEALNDEELLDGEDEDPEDPEEDPEEDGDEDGDEDESDQDSGDNQSDDDSDPAKTDDKKDPIIDTVAPEFQPSLSAEPVENYTEKAAEIETRITTLDSEFEDGDIDMREYRTQLRALEKEQGSLDLQQRDYDNAVKNNNKNAMDRWQWEQDRFFVDQSNQMYKENALLGQTFDTAIKQLAAEAKNEGQPMSWFLEEADRQVRDLFGTQKPPEVVRKKGDPKPRVADKRKNLPPNMGDIPSAEQPDVGGGDEFAAMDKLDGMDLEAALSKLSKSEQDRYLQG
jgi:hypothetical protein